MSTLLSRRLRREAELMRAFAQTYQSKFESIIDRLNRHDPPSDLHCLRLCVEAVNMMLASQQQLASAIEQISQDPPQRPRLAA